MYTIQIVGAGYAGSRIARFFVQKKQKVFALTRSAEKAARLENERITPVVADLTKPETLAGIPFAHFIVICPAPDASGEADYEAVYLKGIGNYLNAIRKNPVPHLIVYISSTGVWQDQVGDVFDESVIPQPKSAKAKILAAAEQQILNCGMPAAVLRLSGIYGPGRNRLKALREGSWPVKGMEDRWMNLIHVDDIAGCLPDFFKSAREGEVYLGTDDEPFLMSDLAGWLCREQGVLRDSMFAAGSPAGRKLKNTKLKELGIRLKYPTYREGYAQIIREENENAS